MTRFVCVLLAVLLTGCTAPQAQPDRPQWRPCGGTAAVEGLNAQLAQAVRDRECTTIEAPLDHADPGGAKIELAITRIRTADPARRIGSLVYNPGGPGASGLDLVAGMVPRYQALLDRYDLVSWDPRGAGSSTPLSCGPDEGNELSATALPTTDAQWAALGVAAEAFAQACNKSEILPHLGLFDSARDIDLVRQAVGDDKLHYLGVSYGGQLGAAYAELFPDRVGRVVLDGPGAPTRTYRQTLLDQAAGSELGFRQLVTRCLATQPCALGTSYQDALAKLDAFLARLDAKPLTTKRGTPLTRGGVVAALTIGFSDPPLWDALTRAIAAAYAGQPDALQAFGDVFTGRRPDGSYSNFGLLNSAVNCLDYPDRVTVASVRAAMPEFAKVSPRFGPTSGLLMLTCVGWPHPGVGREGLIDGLGAAPVVVLGNTGDPLGRYQWARELAAGLDSGVLVTWNGQGHGAYGGLNVCVDHRIEAYLLAGTVPVGPPC